MHSSKYTSPQWGGTTTEGEQVPWKGVPWLVTDNCQNQLFISETGPRAKYNFMPLALMLGGLRICWGTRNVLGPLAQKRPSSSWRDDKVSSPSQAMSYGTVLVKSHLIGEYSQPHIKPCATQLSNFLWAFSLSLETECLIKMWGFSHKI